MSSERVEGGETMSEEISSGDQTAAAPEPELKAQEADLSASETEQKTQQPPLETQQPPPETQQPPPETQQPPPPPLQTLHPPTKIATRPTTAAVAKHPTFKVPALPPLARYKRGIPMLMPPAGTPAGGYHCKVCRQNFFSFPQLVRHKQFHDEERPFPCGVCGKRFLSRSHFNEHQRVHTGERPFPCDQCERSFTTHHNLKRHMMIHSKEEIYRCKTCGVLFCQRHGNALEGYPPEELAELYGFDPESVPQQEEPAASAVVQGAGPKPELAAPPKTSVPRQYRLQEKLQRKLQQRLMRKLKGRGRSSASHLSSLPTLDGSKKKRKKEKKKKRREEERKSKMMNVPAPNKLHRIAYDIEVVL